MHYLVLLCVLILGGCHTLVKLEVRNSSSLAQEARAEVTDGDDVRVEDVQFGTVAPSASAQQELKVKHGHRVQVIGNLPQQPAVFHSGPVTVTRKPDPRSMKVELTVQDGRWLDDKSAQAVIKSAFTDVGPRMPGYSALKLADALGSWYGALVVVPAKASDGSLPNEILFHLKPGQFAPPISEASFQFPSGLSQDTVTIGKDAAAKAAAGFAAFALALQGESSDVMEVKWTFQNFGMVQRQDGAGWNYVKALNELPVDVKNLLARTLADNPGSRAFYIDRMFVFENATYSVRKASKVASNGTMSAAVVTVGGAYTFEQSETKTDSRQRSVLNVVGTPITIVPVKNGKKAPETTDLGMLMFDGAGIAAGDQLQTSPKWSQYLLTTRAGQPEVLHLPVE